MVAGDAQNVSRDESVAQGRYTDGGAPVLLASCRKALENGERSLLPLSRS